MTIPRYLYPPAEVPIECSGSTHRLRWEAGHLEAVDHKDAKAERVLLALGGDECACIESLDTWEAHRVDLRVLSLASRGPADCLVPTDDGVAVPHGQMPMRAIGARARMVIAARTRAQIGTGRVGRGGWFGYAPLSRAGHAEQAEDPLGRLIGLNPVIAHRLSVTVAAEWAARVADNDPAVGLARPALLAALYGRAVLALRGWLGDPKLDARVYIDGELPGVTWDGSRLHVRLGFEWLSTVWGLGLAVIWDRFSLALLDSSPGQLRLLTVGRDLSEQRDVIVAVDSG
jgi:hypothetical protein